MLSFSSLAGFVRGYSDASSSPVSSEEKQTGKIPAVILTRELMRRARVTPDACLTSYSDVFTVRVIFQQVKITDLTTDVAAMKKKCRLTIQTLKGNEPLFITTQIISVAAGIPFVTVIT